MSSQIWLHTQSISIIMRRLHSLLVGLNPNHVSTSYFNWILQCCITQVPSWLLPLASPVCQAHESFPPYWCCKECRERGIYSYCPDSQPVQSTLHPNPKAKTQPEESNDSILENVSTEHRTLRKTEPIHISDYNIHLWIKLLNVQMLNWSKNPIQPNSTHTFFNGHYSFPPIKYFNFFWFF